MLFEELVFTLFFNSTIVPSNLRIILAACTFEKIADAINPVFPSLHKKNIPYLLFPVNL